MPMTPLTTSPRQRRTTPMPDAAPRASLFGRPGRIAAVAALCATLALGAACGKKVMPVPKDDRELFSWKSVTATATANGCIAARGEAHGNVDNLASVIVEVQPLDSADNSCAGCPFQATQRQEFTPVKHLTPQGNAIVEMTMCPDRKAPAYRWRLVGVNVLTRFAHALSRVQALVTDPSAPGYGQTGQEPAPGQQIEIVLP